MDRQDLVERIRSALSVEQNSSAVDISPYLEFLSILKEDTAPAWHHTFVTTNWDVLLENAIKSVLKGECRQPPWLQNSYVFHMNGSIERLPGAERRSQFLLEQDSPEIRVARPETNIIIDQMLFWRMVVLLGISFRCPMDRTLLYALGHLGQDFPVSETDWIVVNPDKHTAEHVATHIKRNLPNSHILRVVKDFRSWLRERIPELHEKGILVVH